MWKFACGVMWRDAWRCCFLQKKESQSNVNPTAKVRRSKTPAHVKFRRLSQTRLNRLIDSNFRIDLNQIEIGTIPKMGSTLKMEFQTKMARPDYNQGEQLT